MYVSTEQFENAMYKYNIHSLIGTIIIIILTWLWSMFTLTILNKALETQCIYLGESKQKTPDGCDHNATHQEEGDVLRPECYININSNPVDCYFHTSCNWIFLSHTIKNNVDC
jgi:hypothetical protein